MVELSTSSPRPAVTGMSLFVAGLGILALIAPLRAAESPATRVGTLLALAALIELLHGSRRATVETRRAALIGGVISLLMGLLLISAPFLAGAALFIVLAGWFAIDGIRYSIKAVRAGDPATRRQAVLAAAGNLSVTVLILITRDFAATWTIAIAGALRIFGIVWNMLVAPVYASGDAEQTVLDDLGLADLPGMSALAAEAETQERLRAPIDRGWTIAFIATLFAIHVSRMESWDGTLLGFVAPGVAVLGDMAIAVIVALAIINPLFLSWRGATRWMERRIWRWYLPTDVQRRGLLARAAGAWLRYRLRISIRFREARYSLSFALRSFLTTGLPYAAIIAATAPVFGMSWYFDTENWAAGIWNSWAESRTDEWREAMVRSVRLQPGAPDDSVIFAVTPPGTSGSGDFAFIVIGDTGEGDASQHSLRDQLLTVAAREDVRFVVISSDVVYPTGSMQVYEPNFWLPFKGVTKPVYAIPGNHDWYDALEAFLATFLQADAARASMRARAEADLRLTSTSSSRIEYLIHEAERLRQQYDVPTGFQRAPFFEIQTDRFALLAIDTGIIKRIDPAEDAWLNAALERARGKTLMAILGHPFYAGGHDETIDNPPFAELKRRLVDRGATILMAGDTHDLEYYSDRAAGDRAVHYFVNGGGGAYLSFGTSLAWPAHTPTSAWAYYPNSSSVIQKIESQTPWWKRPAWWWTRELGAWPFSAEWLSAVFDSNVSPFFQSFVEVRVEPSANRVRILPYGVHGQLRWRDLQASAGLRPPAADENAFVEWSVLMK